MSEPRFCGIGDEAGHDLEQQVAIHHRLGWPAVELRSVGGVHVADLPDAGFEATAGRLEQAGLAVPVLCSRIGSWDRPDRPFDDDLAELAVLTRRARRLGAWGLRVMSYPGLDDPRVVVERFRALARHAEAHGIVLLHENCVGWAASTQPARVLTLVEDVGSPALRCLFDVGNGIAYGYDPVELLTQVLPLVAHVHVKDGRRTPDGPRWTLPGDGEAGVAECVRLLLDAGYSGWWSLEPHLGVVPHEGVQATAEQMATSYVTAGRRLEALVAAAGGSPLAGGGEAGTASGGPSTAGERSARPASGGPAHPPATTAAMATRIATDDGVTSAGGRS